jgi:hypothetical protein
VELMTHDDKVLAAYIAGTVQAALDRARERGYPAEAGLVRPDDSGTWSAVVKDSQGAACIVTITPGQPPAQPARPLPGG